MPPNCEQIDDTNGKSHVTIPRDGSRPLCVRPRWFTTMLLDLNPPLSSLLLFPDSLSQKFAPLLKEEILSDRERVRQALMASTNPITTTTLAVCRWGWCKESFSSQDELVEHVLQEHIEKAVPIKKKDLPLEKRAQLGESFEGALESSGFAFDYAQS